MKEYNFMFFLFTDMFQANINQEDMFEALRHLKHNKHEVVLFHTFDMKTELNFDFDNTPKKFIDIETGEEVNLYAQNIQEKYKQMVDSYFKQIKDKCLQYKIDYVPVDVKQGFHQVLTRYFLSRQKML